jgi:hypothetical protein
MLNFSFESNVHNSESSVASSNSSISNFIFSFGLNLLIFWFSSNMLSSFFPTHLIVLLYLSSIFQSHSFYSNFILSSPNSLFLNAIHFISSFQFHNKSVIINFEELSHSSNDCSDLFFSFSNLNNSKELIKHVHMRNEEENIFALISDSSLNHSSSNNDNLIDVFSPYSPLFLNSPSSLVRFYSGIRISPFLMKICLERNNYSTYFENNHYIFYPPYPHLDLLSWFRYQSMFKRSDDTENDHINSKKCMSNVFHLLSINLPQSFYSVSSSLCPTTLSPIFTSSFYQPITDLVMNLLTNVAKNTYNNLNSNSCFCVNDEYLGYNHISNYYPLFVENLIFNEFDAIIVLSPNSLSNFVYDDYYKKEGLMLLSQYENFLFSLPSTISNSFKISLIRLGVFSENNKKSNNKNKLIPFFQNLKSFSKI